MTDALRTRCVTSSWPNMSARVPSSLPVCLGLSTSLPLFQLSQPSLMTRTILGINRQSVGEGCEISTLRVGGHNFVLCRRHRRRHLPFFYAPHGLDPSRPSCRRSSGSFRGSLSLSDLVLGAVVAAQVARSDFRCGHCEHAGRGQQQRAAYSQAAGRGRGGIPPLRTLRHRQRYTNRTLLSDRPALRPGQLQHVVREVEPCVAEPWMLPGRGVVRASRLLLGVVVPQAGLLSSDGDLGAPFDGHSARLLLVLVLAHPAIARGPRGVAARLGVQRRLELLEVPLVQLLHLVGVLRHRVVGLGALPLEHDERAVVRAHRLLLLRVVPQGLLLPVDLDLGPPLVRLLLLAHAAEGRAVLPRHDSHAHLLAQSVHVPPHRPERRELLLGEVANR
mmetsp:Transcript_25533/g.40820  ORF Transcript_25533/g.40820 Transcript_25533/m.40820 type:complete len:390 (+) Transcript_25533:200-1369(+)